MKDKFDIKLKKGQVYIHKKDAHKLTILEVEADRILNSVDRGSLGVTTIHNSRSFLEAYLHRHYILSKPHIIKAFFNDL